MSAPILPPSILGVVGGGQLGRMFTQAAQRMGYQVAVLTDEADSPAAPVAEHVICADLADLEALRRFVSLAQAATVEFENIPVPALRWIARRIPLNPGWRAVHVAQHRIREKAFLSSLGVPVAPWAAIRNEIELDQAHRHATFPAILKTAQSGYDGKGQIRVSAASELPEAWKRLGRVACVLEQVVAFSAEVSCIVARDSTGNDTVFPVFWNTHHRHILDTTVAPAPIGPVVTSEIQEMSRRIARELGVVGLLTVEFFLTADGHPIVNELAPRPHNSGHLTIDACVTSQFEQQVRALCNLPLGSTRLLAPAAMANLLGDLWEHSADQPAWERGLSLDREAKLHLYGKKEARPGRKMGHVTTVGPDTQTARQRVLAVREASKARPYEKEAHEHAAVT
jgi:5-(carboxyamino)imidazole ribonucleotide synthase